MRMALSFVLPRDEMSIPVSRHIVKAAMENVGVEEESVGDVEVALTEACANVLAHSGPGDEYEVGFELDNRVCTIRIVDTGRGFDFASLRAAPPDLAAERGRGVALMHALVDRAKFVSKPEAGTIVHLEKVLQCEEGSLLDRAASMGPDGAG
jgi:serine/threonine-protein kinase RsbW